MLGSFRHIDSLEEAVEAAERANLEVVDIYSPVPLEGLTERLRRGTSPVRLATFGGGVAGLVGGMALGILTALIWNIVVGGKPVANHVPFVVLGFEAMVLLGALATFGALLFFARLPFRKFPTAGYREEFSLDRFGLWLDCDARDAKKARGVLEQAGAESVTEITAEGRTR
jgi:hypothetical protein